VIIAEIILQFRFATGCGSACGRRKCRLSLQTAQTFEPNHAPFGKPSHCGSKRILPTLWKPNSFQPREPWFDPCSVNLQLEILIILRALRRNLTKCPIGGGFSDLSLSGEFDSSSIRSADTGTAEGLAETGLGAVIPAKSRKEISWSTLFEACPCLLEMSGSGVIGVCSESPRRAITLCLLGGLGLR